MTMFIIKVICERGEENEFKYNRGNFTILSRKYDFKQSDVCNGICSISTLSRIENGNKQFYMYYKN